MISPHFLVSPPRGGSNLVTSFLHNHGEITCSNSPATRRLFAAHFDKGRELATSVAELDQKESVYYQGDIAKKRVLRIIFQFHLGVRKPYKKWNSPEDMERMLTALRSYIDSTGNILFVLIRNPLGILSSRHRFDQKYPRPDWRLGEKSVTEFIAWELVPALKLLRCSPSAAISPEICAAEPRKFMQRMSSLLGIQSDPKAEAFEQAINFYGCKCGGNFTIKDTDDFQSGYLRSLKVKLAPRPHYYCAECDTFLIGYGLFNPLLKVEPKRLSTWNSDFSAEQIGFIGSLFRRHGLDEVFDYFVKGECLEFDSYNADLKAIADNLA